MTAVLVVLAVSGWAVALVTLLGAAAGRMDLERECAQLAEENETLRGWMLDAWTEDL